jgi:hypothetical protein
MTNRKYGISVTVTRDDLEDVELEIKIPQVDRVKVEAENPALRHVFSLFDKAVEKIPAEGITERSTPEEKRCRE